MATVLVLCCSSYGHIEALAKAEADGARAAGKTYPRDGSAGSS